MDYKLCVIVLRFMNGNDLRSMIYYTIKLCKCTFVSYATMIYFFKPTGNMGPTGFILNQVRNAPRFTWQILENFFWYVVDLQHVMTCIMNVFLKCGFLHSVMVIPEVLHSGCLLWGVFLFKSAFRLSITELVACLERDEGWLFVDLLLWFFFFFKW